MGHHFRPIASALALATVVSAAPVAASAQTFYGPIPYLGFVDSPFTSVSFSSYYLETWQDGVLSTPGVSVSPGTGVLTSGPLVDSVDEDDGAVDGLGNSGGTLYSGGNLRQIDFTFSSAALGGLPTHAGIVWTDVGFTDGPLGIGAVVFEAFDGLGVSLGSTGPFTLGDGAAGGLTAEDRFFGVAHASGISMIRIAMPGSGDWEVDHLQYGIAAPMSAVPEPATLWLFGAGLAAVGTLARRARHR